MARLNEAPLPGETIEGLKRRFIRQNREIARANSTQSLRIRSLEAETSRLLSENITLRGENIQLKEELEEGRSKRALDNVYSLKEQMETKLKELSDIVGGLGKAPKLVHGTTPKSRKEGRRSLQRSPNQREWKTSASLADIAGDGRLTPILEDKFYPRRTMEAEEIRATEPDLCSYTDSPDLDPPIAHLIDGELVLENTAAEPTSPCPDAASQKLSESTSPGKLGFANLETRRKRRESNVPAEPQKPEIAPDDQQEASSSSQPLRIGAKRKLSSRNDGPQTSARSAIAGSRNANGGVASLAPQPHDSAVQRRQTAEVLRFSRVKSVSSASGVAGRRVLGEKSVNTNPVVSPIKPRTARGEKAEPIRDLGAQPRKGRKHFGKEEQPVKLDPPRKQLEKPATVLELPPKTPAPLESDILSPTDIHPSTTKIESSRDTPPPADLRSGADTGRPSRRQRAAVSYAEPNLRDKMRRPTKELVDAVGAGTRTDRASGVKAESIERDVPLQEQSTAPRIKSETDNDESAMPRWQDLPSTAEGTQEPHPPPSPLSNKGTARPTSSDGDSLSTSLLPSTVLTDRRRRSSSTSNATLAALMAGSQQRISWAREAAEAARARGLDVSHLDLLDPAGGDPPVVEESQSKGERGLRRHSSVTDFQSGSEGGVEGKTVLGKRGAQSRRATMTASTRGHAKQDRQASRVNVPDDIGTDPQNRESSVEADGKVKASVTTRTERAATRRRSMMV